MRSGTVGGAIALLVAGCASAQTPEPRERFIRAHAHGWVEVAVTDTAIEPLLVESEDGSRRSVPPSCTLIARLDGERFLHQQISPSGDGPLYAASTGFRFAAPAGDSVLYIEYSGCRPVSHPGQSLEFAEPISVSDGMLTRIDFHGDAVHISAPVPDTAATIESVAESVQELRRDIEAE